MSRWGDGKTKLFVSYYREHKCLWDVTSPDYKNKAAREDAYKSILKLMDDPNLTVTNIKIKIKNLRSTYHQELKKIKESLSSVSSNEMYVPTLSWFNDIDSFLGETMESKSTLFTDTQFAQSTFKHESPIEYSNTEPKINISLDQTFRDTSEINESNSNTYSAIKNQHSLSKISKSQTIKRRNHSKIGNILHRLARTSSRNTPRRPQHKDEFHFFGLNVAAQLRSLPLHLALQMQGEIHDKLFIARIKAKISSSSFVTASTSSKEDLNEQNPLQLDTREIVTVVKIEDESPTS